MKTTSIVFGLLAGLVLGALLGSYFARQQVGVEVTAGPHSDNSGAARAEVAQAAAGPARQNELQKLYGGPYTDLSPESQERARKYFTSWFTRFQVLDVNGGHDGDKLAEIFQKEFLPLIQPLKDGTASERKVFLAGQEIYRACAYAAVTVDNSTGDRKELNTLLRLDGMPVDPPKLAYGIGELLLDFLQIAAPSHFESTVREIEAAE